MKEKKLWPIARIFLRPIFHIWIRNIKGLDNLPKKGGFILAPNHSSYLEHFIISAIVLPYLNKQIYFIAKKEHFEKTAERKWHHAWKHYSRAIPIDRSKGKKALDLAVKHLKKGDVIVIYPEGTRTLNGKIQQGKTGAIRLALQANASIVPLGIRGMFDIMPKGARFPKFKRADFHFGKPITYEKYRKRMVTKKLLRTLTDDLMKHIAKLAGQKYRPKS